MEPKEINLREIAKSTKYPLDAFLFVQQGLDYTVRRIHGEPEEEQPAERRHVRGAQLCIGLRDYAIEQYGLMARTVLQRWRIHTCEDFGRIVFALIDAELMLATEEDSIDDFTGVFDFADAFSVAIAESGST